MMDRAAMEATLALHGWEPFSVKVVLRGGERDDLVFVDRGRAHPSNPQLVCMVRFWPEVSNVDARPLSYQYISRGQLAKYGALMPWEFVGAQYLQRVFEFVTTEVCDG
jgi:hypothetical protein